MKNNNKMEIKDLSSEELNSKIELYRDRVETMTEYISETEDTFTRSSMESQLYRYRFILKELEKEKKNRLMKKNEIENGKITSAKKEIGARFGGGIIIYLLKPEDIGYKENEIHGLIVSENDLSEGIQWEDGYQGEIGTKEEIGTGRVNTEKIIDKHGTGNYAAKVCSEYSVTQDGATYNDWYLPSYQELRKLFKNIDKVDGISKNSYWSSSEISDFLAWAMRIPSYDSISSPTKSQKYSIRAFRSF